MRVRVAFRANSIARIATAKGTGLTTSIAFCGGAYASGSARGSATRSQGGVHDWLDNKHERDPLLPSTDYDTNTNSGKLDTSPEAVKRALIEALMMKDREVFDLKRLHALSLHRVELHHERSIKSHEEKAVYFEDNVNKQTLETVEVTEHEFDNVKKHRDMASNMRYLIIFMNIAVTVFTMRWLWFWYADDPRRMYVPVAYKIHNSDREYSLQFSEMLKRNWAPDLMQKNSAGTGTASA
jgi:hypothetical protein